MCVRETCRQVYVYRKGRRGLCECMLARGRVLVIKVSENSRKWLREGGRVILRACVRERHLGRECVSMCQRHPDGYTPCVRMSERENQRVCEEGLWRVKVHVKD